MQFSKVVATALVIALSAVLVHGEQKVFMMIETNVRILSTKFEPAPQSEKFATDNEPAYNDSAYSPKESYVPTAPQSPKISLPARIGEGLKGKATWYHVGQGACGKTSQASDYIVAIGRNRFEQELPPNRNPNQNLLCSRKIKCTRPDKGTNVIVEVLDMCPGCGEDDLDFSPAAFDELAGSGPRDETTRADPFEFEWQWLN